MTIFGIEVSMTADTTKVTAEALVASLDSFHEAITLDERAYSADIVSQGSGEIFMLLGIHAEVGTAADALRGRFDDVIGDALGEAGVDPLSVLVTALAPAKQLAFA